MNKNKQIYSQPEAELLVVRFEQNIMSQNTQSHTEYFIDGGYEEL